MTSSRRVPVALLASLTALVALACLCGCGSESLVDERNIYYIRGVKLRGENKQEEAVKAFETCLRLSPQSGQAHLQLALIYDENLDDPLTAVYHYRRFLEMRPDDANAEAVKEWRQKAEQKLIQRLQQAAVYAAINQGGTGLQLPDSAGPSARELALLARVQDLTAANEELRARAIEPVVDATLAPPPVTPVVSVTPPRRGSGGGRAVAGPPSCRARRGSTVADRCPQASHYGCSRRAGGDSDSRGGPLPHGRGWRYPGQPLQTLLRQHQSLAPVAAGQSRPAG